MNGKILEWDIKTGNLVNNEGKSKSIDYNFLTGKEDFSLVRLFEKGKNHEYQIMSTEDVLNVEPMEVL